MKIATLKTSDLHRIKVVMLGAPAVGKTSLVRRFVHEVFEGDYRSTLGVKVDRKNVDVDGKNVNLLLWDVHGETEGIVVTSSYLQGAHAAILVFDATRPETMGMAAELGRRVRENSPGVEVYVVANKTDLDVNWPVVGEATAAAGFESVLSTSAKTGEGVEQLFLSLATAAIQPK